MMRRPPISLPFAYRADSTIPSYQSSVVTMHFYVLNRFTLYCAQQRVLHSLPENEEWNHHNSYGHSLGVLLNHSSTQTMNVINIEHTHGYNHAYPY
jgi:hypothetical protein